MRTRPTHERLINRFRAAIIDLLRREDVGIFLTLLLAFPPLFLAADLLRYGA